MFVIGMFLNLGHIAAEHVSEKTSSGFVSTIVKND